MKPHHSLSTPRPKPYYNFLVPSTSTRQTNVSRISNLSMSHRPQSMSDTIDITNQIHKYRDLLDGANDQSIMQFMHTLREGNTHKKKLLTKIPKTFRMLQRKSACQSQSKRVSDFSPQPRVSEYYEYWTKHSGSETRDFVNFGCQLRNIKYQPQQNRRPFNYLRTLVSYPPLYEKPSSIHCPKLRNTLKSSRQNSVEPTY